MRPSQVAQVLPMFIDNRMPLLIKGAPGLGKTELVKQACEKTGTDCLISHPVVDDPTDYKGMPYVDKKGEASFVPFTNLKELIEANKATVFFMDDLGQAPPTVQAAAMQLILGRRINGHHVSESVTFFAATNRKEDKAGVTGILEPVKSRFVSIIELESDHEDWVAWAISAKLPPELISFIRFRPELLHKFEPTADITNSPSPRTAENVGRIMKAGPSKDLEVDLYSGAAGEGFASELVGFLRVYRNLPDIDEILKNPKKASVPEDPATLYATCGALAYKASQKTMKPIVTYGGRMPAEFSILLVRDCVRHDETVTETDAFIKWATDNQDVLI